MAVNSDAGKISKKDYDNFPAQKEAANNNIVAIASDIALVSNSKAGWYIKVDDPDAKGTIDIAFKISSDYYLLTIHIDGAGNYPIGDGSGKEGVNHAKIGGFTPDQIPDEEPPPVFE
jgi:hypothetical protein